MTHFTCSSLSSLLHMAPPSLTTHGMLASMMTSLGTWRFVIPDENYCCKSSSDITVTNLCWSPPLRALVWSGSTEGRQPLPLPELDFP